MTIELKDAWTDDERRALDRYAAYLAARDRGQAPRWEDFVGSEPELRELFEEMRFGTSVVEMAYAPSPRRTLWVAAAAALALVTAAVSMSTRAVPAVEVAAVPTDRSEVQHWFQSEARRDLVVGSDGGLYLDLESGGSASSGVRTENPVHLEDQELIVDPIASVAAAYQPVHPSTPASIVDALRGANLLRLSVIDRESKSELYDVGVYSQRVDVVSGEFEEPRFVGRSPIHGAAIGFGLHRLVAYVDAARYSELTVLSSPGVPMSPQVMFLATLPGLPAGMVEIAGTDFLYGRAFDSDRRKYPLHRVEHVETVDDFWIDRREATFAQYQRFRRDVMAHWDAWFPFDASGAPTMPDLSLTAAAEDASVETPDNALFGVSWSAANLFANYLGRRLPTDREWEAAARGPRGQDRRYPWGDEEDRDGVRADAPTGWSVDAITPPFVSGSPVDKPAGRTPDGVYRMADNVAEWVADLACVSAPGDSNRYRLVMMRPPGQLRVTVGWVCRGGSIPWGNSTSHYRTDRRHVFSDTRVGMAGVRCAKSVPEQVMKLTAYQ